MKTAVVSRGMKKPGEYKALLEAVRASFNISTVNFTETMFLTDVGHLLNDIYLDKLPAEIRQEHNCHCCRDFIKQYGGLVTVNAAGDLIPVMWSLTTVDGTPYEEAFNTLHKTVRGAKIVSPFLSGKSVWGTPETGEWTHFSVVNHKIVNERVLTAKQQMAAYKENFKTVISALNEVELKVLEEAVHMFEQEAVAWSTKFVAPAKWLLEQKSVMYGEGHGKLSGARRKNLLWKAIAAAPEGYLHPKSSVLWPLLESIKAGDSYPVIKRKFGAMVQPDRYQRPTAAPAVGAVKAAEELFAKLGLAPALDRRFATLEDLQQCGLSVWEPAQPKSETEKGGVFGHLKTKSEEAEVQSVALPAKTMTWSKFFTTVLPTAEKLQMFTPSHGNYCGVTTAVHADAPPILSWDQDDVRCPVAWYVYTGGSIVSQWNLPFSSWVDITAVSASPTNKKAPHIMEGYFLSLQGARESKMQGNALFPVCLKSELHGVRSVVEAYSAKAVLADWEKATANGWLVSREGMTNMRLRAMTNVRWSVIDIDRWD